MKRLHELTPEQLEEWRRERARVGREKYGDAHLQRYGLVDVMEELLDALNIIELARMRCVGSGVEDDSFLLRLLRLAERDIKDVTRRIKFLDFRVPDELCTDERGGERIWWSEHARDDASE